MNPFRITYLSALTFFIFTFTACSSNNGDNGSQELSENTNRNVITSGMATEITRLEFPRVYAASNDTIIVHYAPEPGSSKKDVNYELAWDKKKKANLFTCYEMYAQNVQHTPGVNRYSPTNWEASILKIRIFCPNTDGASIRSVDPVMTTDTCAPQQTAFIPQPQTIRLFSCPICLHSSMLSMRGYGK